ncbi:hypothetical protein ACN9M0_37300 [Streptomyces sp. R-07]|uniref:hypothetical protein n=1 Tax=unclassified Streptomyces TaxID=2593676 RepID=UPI00342115E2
MTAVLVLVGALAGVMGLFTWLAAHVRRRGGAGAGIAAALAAHDEAFRVTAYESHYEIQAQASRKAPLLSPDDRWTPTRAEAARRSPPRARKTLRHRIDGLRARRRRP